MDKGFAKVNFCKTGSPNLIVGVFGIKKQENAPKSSNFRAKKSQNRKGELDINLILKEDIYVYDSDT